MTSNFSSDQIIHVLTHGWTDTPHASPSIEYQDGIAVRTNLIPNPSFEVDVSGWTGTIVRDTTEQHTGVASGKLVTQGPDYIDSIYAGESIPVSPGQKYFLGVWVKLPADLATAYGSRVAVYDETGEGAALLVANSVQQVQMATDWTLLSMTFTVPTDGAWMDLVLVEPVDWDVPSPAGQVVFVDEVILEVDSAVGNYFDGSTGSIDVTADVTPLLVTQWNATASTRHIVHEVLGNVWPDITIQPAGPRSGTMSALFDNEQDATDLFTMLTDTYVITFSDDSTSVTAMTFLANGQITIQQDDQNRHYWTVSFTYMEVQ